MRRRPRCHGRTLRRCRRPMKFRPRRCYVRGRPRRRCCEMWGRARWRRGDMRRGMWRHRRSLRHGRGMECRRGGTCHRRWGCRTGHGRWCCWPCCRRCGWAAPSMSLAGSLSKRADARRQHRDTNQDSRQANATRKHDRRSQLVIAHDFQRTGGGMVRCRPPPACDLPTQAVSREILRQGGGEPLQQLARSVRHAKTRG
ncbi:hypothetical protein SAMN05192541_1145 [Bradyrhizobium arachidis]|nr:hypothetical protein SAMN05192541_1145 [Bradyrhizobium arachidis]